MPVLSTFLFLQIVDMFVTCYGIRLGILYEINPILAAFFSVFGVLPTLVVFKIMASGLGIALYMTRDRTGFGIKVMTFLKLETGAMLFVVIWQIVQFSRYLSD